MRGIEKIGFNKLYHPDFRVPLPSSMDVVVVVFRKDCQTVNPLTIVPTWEDRAAELKGNVAVFGGIVGRSLCGAVTSKGGDLEVDSDPEIISGSKKICFFLSCRTRRQWYTAVYGQRVGSSESVRCLSWYHHNEDHPQRKAW